MNSSLFLSLAFIGLFSCLAQAQTPPNSASDGPTGIDGIISVSPIRGGPTRQGDSDSKPLSNMVFEVKQGGRVLSSFKTDDRGHFRLSLEPGRYTISRKDWESALGSYGPFEVDVSKGKMTKVDWKCDSGLR